MSFDDNIAQNPPPIKTIHPDFSTISRDDIEERASLIADGEGVTQRQAERILARQYGLDFWTSLLREVGR